MLQETDTVQGKHFQNKLSIFNLSSLLTIKLIVSEDLDGVRWRFLSSRIDGARAENKRIYKEKRGKGLLLLARFSCSSWKCHQLRSWAYQLRCWWDRRQLKCNWLVIRKQWTRRVWFHKPDWCFKKYGRMTFWYITQLPFCSIGAMHQMKKAHLMSQ